VPTTIRTPASVEDVAESAALLVEAVEHIEKAIEEAIDHAVSLAAMLGNAMFPRFNHALVLEAEGIRDDLDGTGGSVFDVDEILRDCRNLVDLVCLARTSPNDA
jgi:hypothetical protein